MRRQFVCSLKARLPAWGVNFCFPEVFGDMPHGTTIVGALIIIAAGFYIFLREQQRGREAEDVGQQV